MRLLTFLCFLKASQQGRGLTNILILKLQLDLNKNIVKEPLKYYSTALLSLFLWFLKTSRFSEGQSEQHIFYLEVVMVPFGPLCVQIILSTYQMAYRSSSTCLFYDQQQLFIPFGRSICRGCAGGGFFCAHTTADYVLERALASAICNSITV